MGQEGKSVGGMSSSCLGELSSHLCKGEEGNRNCILGQPPSWRTELGSNPVSFCLTDVTGKRVSRIFFTGWRKVMRRSYCLRALFPFWACAFHSTCSWFYRAPRILLPNSLQLRQPGDSLLSQQTGRRLRMTVEQHCLGVQGLPLGSSFAPIPWYHTEGTTFPGRERAWKGCFVFSTPSPAPTTSLPPTAKAGNSPSGHG